MKIFAREILLVGSGGFIGSVCRYLLSGWLQKLFRADFFPWGTLGVNVTGCLLIGLVAGSMENRELFPPSFRLFVMIGLLGGFTTFSTFSYEALGLLRDRQMFYASGYIFGHLLLGLGAVWLGYGLTMMKG